MLPTLLRYLPALLPLLAMAPAPAQVTGVAHVVVIGVDGLGPIGIEKAPTPNIDRLIAGGASTMKARGVMPTVSSPNWASMIMGAGPEQHGVLSNDWPKPEGFLDPSTKGPGGIFPTIFGILRQQRPDAYIAVVHDWDDFGRLVEPDTANTFINADGPDETAVRAIQLIKDHKPALLFLHFDHVDHELHGVGFATQPYFDAVAKMDRLTGDILEALEEAGIAESTAVLLTSDHGGAGKSHGGITPDEFTIPWILQGPGVAHGTTIEDTVNTFDTAATIAYLLGIERPQCWIGRPVMGAFSQSKP